MLLLAPAGCKPRSQPAGFAASQGLPTGPSAAGLPPQITTPGGIEMVLVPAGEFMMGNPGDVDSRPVHKVALSPFYMDKHEITQAVYEKLMGLNPSRHKGADHPVERVRWSDAIKFCNARSQSEGLRPCYDVKSRTCDFAAEGYRLPTEAEWEYACRAGSQGDYYFDGGADALAAHAWFKGNAGRTHRPVGRKPPNPFGLYDMAGNVREWCNDRYAVDYYAKSPAADPHGPAAGEKAVLRGGAFSATAESCTSWARYCDDPGFTDACVASDDYGFRCVRRAKAPGGERP
jgi:formylglycine-generating enzyme required for sulfatase activity